MSPRVGLSCLPWRIISVITGILVLHAGLLWQEVPVRLAQEPWVLRFVTQLGGHLNPNAQVYRFHTFPSTAGEPLKENLAHFDAQKAEISNTPNSFSAPASWSQFQRDRFTLFPSSCVALQVAENKSLGMSSVPASEAVFFTDIRGGSARSRGGRLFEGGIDTADDTLGAPEWSATSSIDDTEDGSEGGHLFATATVEELSLLRGEDPIASEVNFEGAIESPADSSSSSSGTQIMTHYRVVPTVPTAPRSLSSVATVVGGGLAGLLATLELSQQQDSSSSKKNTAKTSMGAQPDIVVLVESSAAFGGRVNNQAYPAATTTTSATRASGSAGGMVEIGATFIHGIEDNPIMKLAHRFGLQTTPVNYDSFRLFDAQSGAAFEDDLVDAVKKEVYDAARVVFFALRDARLRKGKVDVSVEKLFQKALKSVLSSGKGTNVATNGNQILRHLQAIAEKSGRESVKDIAADNITTTTAQGRMSPFEQVRSVLSWHFFWEIVQDQIAPLADLGAFAYDASLGFRGPDHVFSSERGIQALIDALLCHIVSKTTAFSQPTTITNVADVCSPAGLHKGTPLNMQPFLTPCHAIGSTVDALTRSHQRDDNTQSSTLPLVILAVNCSVTHVTDNQNEAVMEERRADMLSKLDNKRMAHRRDVLLGGHGAAPASLTDDVDVHHREGHPATIEAFAPPQLGKGKGTGSSTVNPGDGPLNAWRASAAAIVLWARQSFMVATSSSSTLSGTSSNAWAATVQHLRQDPPPALTIALLSLVVITEGTDTAAQAVLGGVIRPLLGLIRATIESMVWAVVNGAGRAMAWLFQQFDKSAAGAEECSAALTGGDAEELLADALPADLFAGKTLPHNLQIAAQSRRQQREQLVRGEDELDRETYMHNKRTASTEKLRQKMKSSALKENEKKRSLATPTLESEDLSKSPKQQRLKNEQRLRMEARQRLAEGSSRSEDSDSVPFATLQFVTAAAQISFDLVQNTLVTLDIQTVVRSLQRFWRQFYYNIFKSPVSPYAKASFLLRYPAVLIDVVLFSTGSRSNPFVAAASGGTRDLAVFRRHLSGIRLDAKTTVVDAAGVRMRQHVSCRRPPYPSVCGLAVWDTTVAIVTVPLGVLQESLSTTAMTSATNRKKASSSSEVAALHDPENEHNQSEQWWQAKSAAVVFYPPLPPLKRTAIASTGCSETLKMALQFDIVFWPADVEFFGFSVRPPHAKRDDWGESLSLKTLMSDRAYAYGDAGHVEFVNLHKHRGNRILILEVERQLARRWSLAANHTHIIAMEVMPLLHRAFCSTLKADGLAGACPLMPSWFAINNYVSSPNIRCGFSYWRPGRDGGDNLAMREGLWPDRLLWSLVQPDAQSTAATTVISSNNNRPQQVLFTAHHVSWLLHVLARADFLKAGHKEARDPSKRRGLLVGPPPGLLASLASTIGGETVVAHASSKRLLFAGEHTTPDLYGNMHGAVVEGQRAAVESRLALQTHLAFSTPTVSPWERTVAGSVALYALWFALMPILALGGADDMLFAHTAATMGASLETPPFSLFYAWVEHFFGIQRPVSATVTQFALQDAMASASDNGHAPPKRGTALSGTALGQKLGRKPAWCPSQCL